MDKDIKIAYFQAHTNNGTGYVCIALKQPPKEETNHTYWGAFAFCSPKDSKKFSKHIARQTAITRLKANKACVSVTYEEKAEKLNEVFSELLARAAVNIKHSKEHASGKIVHFMIAPSWLVRALEKHRVQFGLTQRIPELCTCDVS
jgi:hypothetical protein